ncbi:FAD-binding oxidoreductase [Brachybacterium sp. P6-10-X1]|uniref:FAD-binding oxidoreductase n=1 Tax=Brachybacterium sp. P6-10-X1 TaxID=1903186 RepID=UPI001C12A9E1|nr:FAD-binding oxidoreductase [Brachybacterium sp. P6-10-X1]
MSLDVIQIPTPPPRRSPGLDTRALEHDLSTEVDGEVRFDPGSRGSYATDASNYRQVPIGVVVPRSVEAGAAAIDVCARHGAPVLPRGGGTSLGGQCTNVAVVIDWTKYCNRLISVDAEAQTCLVEPGIVLDELNAQLAPYGLEFGPRPSTHSHCALGGMLGNNACGATAQRSGKTDENVVALEILTHAGTRWWAGPTSDEELEGVRARRAGVRHPERPARCRRPLRRPGPCSLPGHPAPRLRLQPQCAAAGVVLRHRTPDRGQRGDAGDHPAGGAEAHAHGEAEVDGRPRLRRHHRGG